MRGRAERRTITWEKLKWMPLPREVLQQKQLPREELEQALKAPRLERALEWTLNAPGLERVHDWTLRASRLERALEWSPLKSPLQSGRLLGWSGFMSGLWGFPDWSRPWSGLWGNPCMQNSHEIKGKDGLLDYGSSEIRQLCGDLWDHRSWVLQDHLTWDQRSQVLQDHLTWDHWSRVLLHHWSL